MLFLSLYLLWVLLCGRVTAEILLWGLPAAGLVFLFAVRALDYPWRRDLQLLRSLPRAFRYLLFLLKEVLVCSLRVLRLIWSPGAPESGLAEFDPRVRTRPGRVVLAASITLTPGTITVETEPGRFLVHCLEASSAPGLPEGPLARKIRNLEDHAA